VRRKIKERSDALSLAHFGPGYSLFLDSTRLVYLFHEIVVPFPFHLYMGSGALHHRFYQVVIAIDIQARLKSGEQQGRRQKKNTLQKQGFVL
jgi:hypothetical protein